MTGLSVVIPALNEAATLPLLLADLATQHDCRPQVIVADGGSTDGTADAARAAGATVVSAPRGRGAQMNAGAAAATGRHLLFLHADTRIAEPTTLRRAIEHLDSECRRAGHPRVAGHFALEFERKQPGHERVFQYLEAKTALGRPGTINGDQGLLLATSYFRELGGFESGLPFLEDQKLAARIFATGAWVLLPGRLVTSARRFETEGVRHRLSLMALLMGLHAAGQEALLAGLPGIYAEQHRAGPLKLAPFHRHVRRSLWRSGPRNLLRVLWRGGRYVRANAWQLAFRRDVRRHGADAALRHPSLDRFDRWLAPALDNPVMDALATLLLSIWLYAWLPVTENR